MRWVRRRLGFGGTAAGARPQLEAVGPSLPSLAAWLLPLTALVDGIRVIVMDAETRDVVLDTLAGAVMFGVIVAVSEIRHQVPRGKLYEPPPEAFRPVGDGGRGLLWRLALLVPLAFASAYFAEHLTGVIIPGQIAGMGVASLAGSLLVRRWERRHGCRVLGVRHDGRYKLFAASVSGG